MTVETQAGSHAKSTEPLRDERDLEVQVFFDRYAEALTMGDIVEIVACWNVPAFVLADQGARAITSTEEVERFFARTKEHYNARGVYDTKAILDDIVWLTPRIVSVDVHWPWYGPRGEDRGEESSSYLLRIDDDENLRLHAAVMCGADER